MGYWSMHISRYGKMAELIQLWSMFLGSVLSIKEVIIGKKYVLGSGNYFPGMSHLKSTRVRGFRQPPKPRLRREYRVLVHVNIPQKNHSNEFLLFKRDSAPDRGETSDANGRPSSRSDSVRNKMAEINREYSDSRCMVVAIAAWCKGVDGIGSEIDTSKSSILISCSSSQVNTAMFSFVISAPYASSQRLKFFQCRWNCMKEDTCVENSRFGFASLFCLTSHTRQYPG